MGSRQLACIRVHSRFKELDMTAPRMTTVDDGRWIEQIADLILDRDSALHQALFRAPQAPRLRVVRPDPGAGAIGRPRTGDEPVDFVIRHSSF
jgi:hypothetical protein